MITELSQPHVLLGAYLLGGLRPDEVRTFTDHLPSCPACRRELEAVATLPALLGSFDKDCAARIERPRPQVRLGRRLECAGARDPGCPLRRRQLIRREGPPGGGCRRGRDGSTAVTS